VVEVETTDDDLDVLVTTAIDEEAFVVVAAADELEAQQLL